MKPGILTLFSLFFVLLSACTNTPDSEPASLPTLTPSSIPATNTPLPTAIPKPPPTATPTPSVAPTQTLEPTPTTETARLVQVLAYLYGGSGFDPELSGSGWDYIHNDNYGNEGSCLIYYSPEDDAEENEGGGAEEGFFPS